MDKKAILNIKSLSKSFTVKNKGKRKGLSENKFLLNELSLPIEAGKITALIGGNGTGKTTLFNIISGFTRPDKGKISFTNGKTYQIADMLPHKISRLGIGRLFQDNHVFNEMTVMENMKIADDKLSGENILAPLFLYRKCRNEDRLRTEEAEMIFENLFGTNHFFKDKFHHKAGSLSYGQQRLLGLARLMMAGNKLLLLDEPTSGVHPQNIDNVKLALKRMMETSELTIFLIEHNMKFVSETADICAFINEGRIAMLDTPAKVLSDEMLRKSYLGI